MRGRERAPRRSLVPRRLTASASNQAARARAWGQCESARNDEPHKHPIAGRTQKGSLGRRGRGEGQRVQRGTSVSRNQVITRRGVRVAITLSHSPRCLSTRWTAASRAKRAKSWDDGPARLRRTPTSCGTSLNGWRSQRTCDRRRMGVRPPPAGRGQAAAADDDRCGRALLAR